MQELAKVLAPRAALRDGGGCGGGRDVAVGERKLMGEELFFEEAEDVIA